MSGKYFRNFSDSLIQPLDEALLQVLQARLQLFPKGKLKIFIDLISGALEWNTYCQSSWRLLGKLASSSSQHRLHLSGRCPCKN